MIFMKMMILWSDMREIVIESIWVKMKMEMSFL